MFKRQWIKYSKLKSQFVLVDFQYYSKIQKTKNSSSIPEQEKKDLLKILEKSVEKSVAKWAATSTQSPSFDSTYS